MDYCHQPKKSEHVKACYKRKKMRPKKLYKSIQAIRMSKEDKKFPLAEIIQVRM